MISHQHVGVDGATALLRLLIQPAEVRPIILVGEDTGLVIVAALNQVQRYPGKGDAWPPWHVGVLLD